jgi:RNA polymerase sigma factor (sigma-70 family)
MIEDTLNLDLQLIQRIVAKDAEALEALYDRYEKPLYAFAYRLTQDRMMAEEVVQECFVRVWNAGVKFDAAQGKLTTWLFTIVRNASIDLLRKGKRRQSEGQLNDDHLMNMADERHNIEQAVEWDATRQEIKAALSTLNEDQKDIIELIYFKGFTQQEVSDNRNIPLGTVKSRVRLAFKQLKSKLYSLGKEGSGQ